MDQVDLQPKLSKMPVREHSWLVDPYEAIYRNVLPYVQNDGWLEVSEKLADTNMSSREWAGLAVLALSLEAFLGQYFLVGTDERDGDGLVSPRTDSEFKSAMFVEQTLATERGRTIGLEALANVIASKRQKQYEPLTHLIVWANIDGEISGNELHRIMDESGFKTISVIATENDKVSCYFHVAGSTKLQICDMAMSDLLKAAIERHNVLANHGKVPA